MKRTIIVKLHLAEDGSVEDQEDISLNDKQMELLLKLIAELETTT